MTSKLWNTRTVGKWRKAETDYHPPPAGYVDWQVALARFLIAQGTDGIRQGLITKQFGNWATAEVVVHELECLRAEGKAQLFKVPTKRGQVLNYWRATERILK